MAEPSATTHNETTLEQGLTRLAPDGSLRAGANVAIAEHLDEAARFGHRWIEAA